MRLRLVIAIAIVALSVSTSFAESPIDDYESSTGSGSSFNWSGASGFLEAGGAAALLAGLVDMFKDHSSGTHVSVVSTSSASEAPEISTSGTAAGLALLAGAVLIAREKRRKQLQ